MLALSFMFSFFFLLAILSFFFFFNASCLWCWLPRLCRLSLGLCLFSCPCYRSCLAQPRTVYLHYGCFSAQYRFRHGFAAKSHSGRKIIQCMRSRLLEQWLPDQTPFCSPQEHLHFALSWFSCTAALEMEGGRCLRLKRKKERDGERRTGQRDFGSPAEEVNDNHLEVAILSWPNDLIFKDGRPGWFNQLDRRFPFY